MRSLTLLIILLVATLSLTACGGSQKKAEPGSLVRTYKLIDEQGRESGSLILKPSGGAELRDASGNLVGSFSATTAAPEVAPEAEPAQDADAKKQ